MIGMIGPFNFGYASVLFCNLSKFSLPPSTAENPCGNAAAWPASRSQEDLAHVTNSQDEGKYNIK